MASSSSPRSRTFFSHYNLPVTALREKIVEKIQENRVTLIVGDTGCDIVSIALSPKTPNACIIPFTSRVGSNRSSHMPRGGFSKACIRVVVDVVRLQYYYY
ncbi:hypothetical protein AAC387_Pa06g0622 [Persea americana]